MAGLSPEEINRAVATNVAGSKLLQDSVQNIFENNQKQAYTDYLDRLPQDRVQVDRWEHIPGGDGFYWLKDKNTGEIKPTKIPVQPKTSGAGGGSAGMAPKVVIGYDKDNNPVFGVFNPRDQTITPPKNQPQAAPPTTPSKLPTESAKLDAASAAERESLSTIIQGRGKDPKTKQDIKPTQAHIDRFNALSNGREFAFIRKTPGKVFGEAWPNATPTIIPDKDLQGAYQFFIGNGGKGTIEQFKSNPDIVNRVLDAMGGK